MNSKTTQSGNVAGQRDAERPRGYTITISAAELDEKIRSKLAESQLEIEIRGFRKGKVPMTLLKKQFGSRQVTLETSDESPSQGDESEHLDHISELFDAVRDVARASIQAGDKLFVKSTGDDGESSFEVIDLSPSELEYLSDHPETLARPEAILDELRGVRGASDLLNTESASSRSDVFTFEANERASLILDFEQADTNTLRLFVPNPEDAIGFESLSFSKYESVTVSIGSDTSDTVERYYLSSMGGEQSEDSSTISFEAVENEEPSMDLSFNYLIENTSSNPVEISNEGRVQDDQILNAIIAAELQGANEYLDSVNKKVESAILALQGSHND